MRSLAMHAHTYTGTGRCVFCMEVFDRASLTDEHIIPEAIHGSLVISRGSCKPCATQSNSDYENEALNSDLQIPRVLLGLRGKSKNSGPINVRHMPPVFRGNSTRFNISERIGLSMDEYPKIFFLPHFEPPGLLAGIDRKTGLTGMSIGTICTLPGKWMRDTTVMHNPTTISFPKMIAKIGYCYAVAEKGFDSFDGDQIRALLRKERDDVLNFVGNSEQEERLGNHHLHGLYFRRSGDWLTVLVDLFASLGKEGQRVFPYKVVVGKLR